MRFLTAIEMAKPENLFAATERVFAMVRKQSWGEHFLM